MEPPTTRADVAADYGCFFGLGEMSEREIVGGEIAADVMLFRERKDKADMGQGCRSWCDCAILPTWSSVVATDSR
ncbi:hypothetical protein WN943_001516 [Citrus x changshan-huyou]